MIIGLNNINSVPFYKADRMKMDMGDDCNLGKELGAKELGQFDHLEESRKHNSPSVDSRTSKETTLGLRLMETEDCKRMLCCFKTHICGGCSAAIRN